MSKVITLKGGPRDGDRIAVSGDKGIVMVPTLEDAKTNFFGMKQGPINDHTIGHAYAVQPDGTAKYLGKKSRHELRAEHGDYRREKEDRDDDWWKGDGDGQEA